MATASLTRRMLFFIVLIVSVVIGLLSFRAADVSPDGAPRTEFFSEIASAHIQSISQKPHPMGSEENLKVRDYIVAELLKLGITAEIQTTQVPEYYTGQPSKLVDLNNIIAVIPGTASSGTIALSGHYDTVPTSFGANDDGSAVATLLEAARVLLAGPPLRNNVLLLFTDGEEPGQFRYGARYFVDSYDNVEDIRVVLNFEALGKSGPSIMFETAPGNDWLIEAFSKATPNPVAFSFMSDLYRSVARGGTDFIAFEESGINGMDFAYPFERTIYHTALDASDTLELRSLQHHGDYATDLTRYFGNQDLDESASGGHQDYVFHSFFGTTLVYYPQVWGVALTIVTGLLLILVMFTGFKRGKLTPGGMIFSTGLFIIELIGIVILTTLLWWGLDEAHHAFGIVVEPTIKTHLLFIAVLLLSFVAIVLFRKFTAKRLGFQNRIVGALVFWWLITLLATFWLPGFNMVFAVPLAFGLIPIAWALIRAKHPNTWEGLIISSICAFVIIGITVAPIYLLFQAMGVSSPGFSGSPSFPIIGLALFFWVMLLSLLMTPFRIFGELGRKKVLYSITGIAVVLLATGVLLPGIDIESLLTNQQVPLGF